LIGFFFFSDSSEVVLSKISASLVFVKVGKESFIKVNKPIDFLVCGQEFVRELARISLLTVPSGMEILAGKV
jgi:hypothetical protein